MAEAQPPAEDAPAAISLRVKTLTGDEHALTVAPDVRASAFALSYRARKQDRGCL